MSQEKWIVFDLDDVVFNFREQWIRSSLLEGIELPHWTEWPSYNDLSYFKLNDEKQMNAMFIKHQCLEMAEVEPYAREAMIALKEAGYHIGALSARSWHPQAYDITTASFKRNNLPVDKLVLSGTYFDKKSNHLDKFNNRNVFGFIDDSVSHVKDIKSHNIPNVYMLQRPWNKDYRKDHLSVSNLLEFAQNVLLKKNYPLML